MRGFKAALAAVLICTAPMALTACATRAGPSVTAHQTAQRAMLAAETAFNVAATAEIDAKATGILVGDNAVKADAIRKQAYQVLLSLRAVYAAGKTPDLTSLLLLTNQLLILAGQTPPVVSVPVVPTF